MRCKNCGSENEENLYICQNCGSPLYDEEPIEETQDEMGNTKIVPVVAPSTPTQKPSGANGSNNENRDNDDEKKKKTQTTAIIIVLALVLVVVVGVLIGVLVHNSKNQNNEESTSTTVSTTAEVTTEKNQITTTTTTTTEAPTTTTQPQTTTTEAKQYMVEVSCSNGGTVNGRGMYSLNEECTVNAVVDPGYEFDGWYINGKRVSSSSSYTFTVKADTNLEAVFTEQIMEQE